METEEHSLTFTIDNNGVARSTDGSLLWNLHHPPPSSSEERHLQEEVVEEAEFLDDDDDDDVSDYFDDDVITTLDPLLDRKERLLSSYEDLRDLMAGFLRQARAQRGSGGSNSEEDGATCVPASSAAVAGLEKRAFHAAMAEGRGAGAITGCAICLDNFDDGEEVTGMPCSHGHEFHPGCITKWLGKSNTCPLCRHALPADNVMDDDDGM